MDERWSKRANSVLAQGWTSPNSKRSDQYVSTAPSHVIGGKGCKLTDSNGNSFIDFVAGLGSNTLGYAHPRVNEAVTRAISMGSGNTSLPLTLEVETAELIRDLVPNMEKVRFLKTGNEATLAACRIARAYTKKGMIKTDGYHGHGDMWTSLTFPGIGVWGTFHVKQFEGHMNTNDAGLILEPIGLDASDERRRELARHKSSCKNAGAVMIFDEVITGMRVPGYTVGSFWENPPDITCLGKGIANGYALSVVGGRKDVMDCGEYFVSSTFSGEGIGLAACKATLEELKKKSMKDLWFYAKRFMDKFNDICKHIDVAIRGYGVRGMLPVTERNCALLMQECAKGGILLGKAFFYNFAHMEENIDEYVFNIIEDAVNKIKSGGVELEGDAPRETFKR